MTTEEADYDKLIEEALEEARVERSIEGIQPDAMEVLKTLRAEFRALPVPGLKALRVILDAVIREKEAR